MKKKFQQFVKENLNKKINIKTSSIRNKTFAYSILEDSFSYKQPHKQHTRNQNSR